MDQGIEAPGSSGSVRWPREEIRRGRRTAREPHAFETMVGLEVSKAHLDALAFIPRLKEALCPHESSYRGRLRERHGVPVEQPYSGSIVL